MNNLAIRQEEKISYLPSVAEMEQITSITKVLSTCPYYQKLGPGGVLAIWLAAREMNLPPMMALNGGMYTFSGLVSLSAQMINMMIVNAGHRADVIELTDTKCHIVFWRCDRVEGQGKTFPYTFTMEMAQKAGYGNKDNWKKHPRDMLFSRCLSGGARKFMPDVLMNAYVHGELEDDGHIVPVMPDISITEKSAEKIQMPIENIVVNKITKKQAEELHAILKECDESYKESVRKKLEEKKYKLVDLPNEIYEIWKKEAIENRELNLAVLKEKEQLINIASEV